MTGTGTGTHTDPGTSARAPPLYLASPFALPPFSHERDWVGQWRDEALRGMATLGRRRRRRRVGGVWWRGHAAHTGPRALTIARRVP